MRICFNEKLFNDMFNDTFGDDFYAFQEKEDLQGCLERLNLVGNLVDFSLMLEKFIYLCKPAPEVIFDENVKN